MPTIDPSKDYYAALETTPTCSESDIKKQYHKLARLYHPDRNQGKEAEYRPLFQRIQEAYEILNDPEQRTKYDIKRKSRSQASFRPTPPGSAQRSSAYQATSDFPPPPRRAGFQRTNTEVPPTARTSGTRQYTSWTPPVPPPRETTSAAKEARERAAKFSAWEAMNRSRGSVPVNQQQPQQRKHNVPPPYQAQQRPVPTPPKALDSDLRAEFNRQRAKSGDTPPRSANDEPRGPNLFRAASSRATKKQGFDPYSSDVGGYESPVKGPSAYRTTSIRADSPHPSHHPTSHQDSQQSDQASRPNFSFGNDAPFAEGTPKEKTPYPSNSGEKTYFDLRRASSLVDTTKLSANDARTMSQERRKSEFAGSGTIPRPTATFTTSPTHSEESVASSEGSSVDATPSMNGHRKSRTSESDGPLKSSLRSGAKQNDKPGVRFDRFAQFQEPMHRSSDPQMRQSSRDGSDISPTDKARAMDSEPSSPPVRSSSFPNMTRLASDGGSSMAQEPDDGNQSSDFADAEHPSSPDAKAFRAEDFEDQRWTFDSAPNPQSPNKARPEPRSRGSGSESRSSVRSRTSGRSGTPVPTTLEEEEAGVPEVNGHDQGEPMDIDIEPVAPNRKPSVVISDTDRPDQVPRAVYVETSNPQWRSREEGSFNGDRRPSLPNLGSFSMQSPAGHSPSPSRSKPPPPNAQPSKSHIDFSGWHSVTPFGPSGAINGKKGAAFDNMKGELGTTLPFPSQASSSHPFPAQFRPPSQDIPNPPKPPPMPASMGREYCSKLFVYISAYHSWYAQITARLQEVAHQQMQFTTNLQSPTSPNGPRSSIHPQWIDLYGETPTQRGWDSYLRVQQEEARLRTTLNVAAERHRLTLEAHQHLREKNKGAVAASYHRPMPSR